MPELTTAAPETVVSGVAVLQTECLFVDFHINVSGSPFNHGVSTRTPVVEDSVQEEFDIVTWLLL